MNGLLVGSLFAIVYLLVEARKLKRERDQLQFMWLQEALARREEKAAAQVAFDELMEEHFGSERLENGQILLPPMSLN